MKGSRNSIYSIFIAGLALIILTSACGFATGPVNKPIVKVEVLSSDDSFVAGQTVALQVLAADAKGVARIELEIDGKPFITIPANPVETSLIFSQPWMPVVPGSHVVIARAYNVDEQASDVATLVINVEPAAEEEAAANEAQEPDNTGAAETTASGPDSDPATGVDVVGASSGDTLEPVAPAAAGEPASSLPVVTTLTNLNVRSGPGLAWPIIGQLALGESALVSAKSPDGLWYQIVYPAGSDARGWVSGSAEYVKSYGTENVPITAIPLLPTATPQPTATATPPPPTATTPPPTDTPEPPAAAPTKPVIYSFTANQYTITAGESVVLQWDLANAQVAYLHYNGAQEGVVAPGSKMVSPDSNTVYTLIAHNDAGDTYAQIEIIVNPVVNPGNPVPIPTLDLKPIPGFLLPTPTPKFEILPIPGYVITPQPTFELIPGFLIPSP